MTQTLTHYPTLRAPERERLAKLAAFLEQLPEDYDHFSMSQYFTTPYDSLDDAMMDYALTGEIKGCGTVACALGHGPAAGIPIEMAKGSFYHCWRYYSDLFTGGDRFLWQWLFSEEWVDADNTPAGAAARIRYVLADQLLPIWEADDEDEGDENFDRAMRHAGSAGTPWTKLYEPYLR